MTRMTRHEIVARLAFGYTALHQAVHQMDTLLSASQTDEAIISSLNVVQDAMAVAHQEIVTVQSEAKKRQHNEQ